MVSNGIAIHAQIMGYHCHIRWSAQSIINAVLESASRVALAMGLGKQSAVRVWTGKLGQYHSWPVRKPDPQHFGGWNQFAYPPTCRLCGLARPVGSNLRFYLSGFSIYGCIQISYFHVQNIQFGISLPWLVLLTAFAIKTSRDRLPATSWSCVWTMIRLASWVILEVQNTHIDS